MTAAEDLEPIKKINYEDEPAIRWDLVEIDKFLLWCADHNASDVLIKSSDQLLARIDGVWLRVTQRNITTNEIESLMVEMTRTSASSARLQGAQDINFRHEVKRDRFSSAGFRVNATAMRDGWSFGIALVLRAIPSLPPKIEDLGVEDEIMRSAFPLSGIVLVCGAVGTGKSTLLASSMRHILETQPRHIITYEDPIEYDLMNIPNAIGVCVQSEIPLHLSDFAKATANATRRAPDVVMLGESREPETLRGFIEQAETGVAAYTTVHTRSVAEAPARIINIFPHEAQRQVTVTLLSCMKMIIQQRLVPKEGGGRIALREFLAFDSSIRDDLIRCKQDEVVLKIKKYVADRGQPMIDDAKLKFEEGLISRETYNTLLQEFI